MENKAKIQLCLFLQEVNEKKLTIIIILQTHSGKQGNGKQSNDSTMLVSTGS